MPFPIVSLIGALAKPVAKLIDDLHTSDEEKAEAHLKLHKVTLEAEQKAKELELQFEQELSKRHAADMASTSWLSKNIRPLTLVFLLGVTGVLAFMDGNLGTFSVDVNYIDLYKSLLLLAFGFYFGSRGLEKVAGIITAVKK